MNLSIISGGHTGIDRMGLEVALELGLPTGGTAPKDYRTEDGPDHSLVTFGLREHSKPANVQRTHQNVMDSDGTVLYSDTESRGCKATIGFCQRANKPYLINPAADELSAFIRDTPVHILNVAGNRMSKLTPDLLDAYRTSLRQALLPFADL
jgi:hypothetical protein